VSSAVERDTSRGKGGGWTIGYRWLKERTRVRGRHCLEKKVTEDEPAIDGEQDGVAVLLTFSLCLLNPQLAPSLTLLHQRSLGQIQALSHMAKSDTCCMLSLQKYQI
jgi:hypothetical protein